MNNQQFPKEDVGTHQPERYIHDIEFLNYHFNHDKWDWFRKFTPEYGARLEEDFYRYLASDWTVTTVEAAGAATEALTDLVNGVLLVTNGTADDDRDELLTPSESFKLLSGFPFYASFRFKLTDVLQSDFWFGLITGVSYWAATPDDAVIFSKQDGDANLDVITRTNAAQLLTDTTIDLVALTWYRLGIHWDGYDTIRFFVYRDADMYCLAQVNHTTYICSDEEMRLGFGLMNGEALAKAIYVDYIKGVNLRAIE